MWSCMASYNQMTKLFGNLRHKQRLASLHQFRASHILHHHFYMESLLALSFRQHNFRAYRWNENSMLKGFQKVRIELPPFYILKITKIVEITKY